MPSLTTQTALASLNTTKEAFPWLDRSVRPLRCLPTPQHLPLDLVQQAASLITNKKAAYPPPSILERIPVEIFRHIFVRYAEKDVPLWPDDFRFPAETEATFFLGPLPLSHVCGLWRDICLASPELWSTIEVRSSIHFSGTITRGHVQLTRLWLRRSADHPVSLFLRYFGHRSGRDKEPPHPENMDAVVALFACAFPRSKRIEMAIEPSFKTLHILRKVDASHLPLLSAGHIWLASITGVDIPGQVQVSAELGRIFHSAPKISEVHYCPYWPVPKSAPWSQFTSIAMIIEIGYDEAYSILCHCAQLETLVINGLTAGGLLDPPLLVLPRLLRLNILADEFIFTFFDNLKTPCLSSLQLDVTSRVEKPALSFLARFLERSECSLKYLGFSGEGLEGVDLLALAMPWLQSLNALFLALPLNDALCELLTMKNESAVIHDNPLPSLEYLNVIRLKTTDGVFSRMIHSRFRSQSPSRNQELQTHLYRFKAWADFPTAHERDSAAISRMLGEGLQGTLGFYNAGK